MVAVRTWSVSVDEELARRAEAQPEGRPLSGFEARAVDHELEREVPGAHLDDLGRVWCGHPELIEQYDAAWP
jgi:acyl-CoA synthetase (AMP-forming)/AMP-acid ligase II